MYILHYIIYHIISYHNISYHIILYYIISYYVILCYIVLCYIIIYIYNYIWVSPFTQRQVVSWPHSYMILHVNMFSDTTSHLSFDEVISKFFT